MSLELDDLLLRLNCFQTFRRCRSRSLCDQSLDPALLLRLLLLLLLLLPEPMRVRNVPKDGDVFALLLALMTDEAGRASTGGGAA